MSTQSCSTYWCDNKSACAWVNYKCKESLIRRRLVLVFMGLLLNSNLGIQAEYLNTHENFIADEISRLRLLTTKDSFNFDYAKLLSTYPQQLTGCKQFSLLNSCSRPFTTCCEQRIAGSVDHKRMDTRDARTLWFLRFLADHNINEIDL